MKERINRVFGQDSRIGMGDMVMLAFSLLLGIGSVEQINIVFHPFSPVLGWALICLVLFVAIVNIWRILRSHGEKRHIQSN